MEGMNFAAIDIGTNAARLLIKNIDHNPLGETKFRKVLFIRYPLRLGMDVFSKGKIGKERAEMMMHMIKGFKQMMRMYDVVDYRACATSAMRDAKNGKALIKKIEKKTGIRIDLIEGKEEAGILYGNHIEKLPNKEGTFMYVDVGGGSTEITLERRNAITKQGIGGVLAAYTTLPVIGVPMATSVMGGMDSLLSIVQMPKGIPVATVAIDGADNAAILA